MADDCLLIFVDVNVRQFLMIDSCCCCCKACPRRSSDVMDFFTTAMLLLLMMLLLQGSGLMEVRNERVKENSTFLLMARALEVKSENSLTLCWRLKT